MVNNNDKKDDFAVDTVCTFVRHDSFLEMVFWRKFANVFFGFLFVLLMQMEQLSRPRNSFKTFAQNPSLCRLFYIVDLLAIFQVIYLLFCCCC